MNERKNTKRGEARKFLESVFEYEGDDCIIWPYATTKGYPWIKWDGVRSYGHRIVCAHRNGPPPTPKHQAAHSCGNGVKGCVTPSHLRWATPKENGEDTVKHGKSVKGSRHGASKFTEDDIRFIRASDGTISRHSLACMFSTTPQYISAIIQRQKWSWLA